jgi:glycosyltransferase involved in cell wall biosynthesis
MQSTGKISVLMAVYNAQATIAVALRSILAQTRQADEIIIVNDGSTDNTGRILEEFYEQHELRVVSLTENRGFTAAINTGLSECRCVWIARLDADDWWNSDHLETLERSLTKAEDSTSLIATRARYWKDESRQVGESCGPMFGDTLRCFMMHDNPFVHSAVIFRLEAARRVGGYPSGVRWEDYGLWIALMSIDNALIVDATTVNCQKRTGSLSSVSKLVALQGRLEMQQRAWRLFRRWCPLIGGIGLAKTWVRLSFATAKQWLLC